MLTCMSEIKKPYNQYQNNCTKQRAILRDIFSNGYLNYLEWLQASLHYPSISDLSRNWPVLLDESIEVAAEGVYFCFLNCTFFNHYS